jgi:hypothetical protein
MSTAGADTVAKVTTSSEYYCIFGVKKGAQHPEAFLHSWYILVSVIGMCGLKCPASTPSVDFEMPLSATSAIACIHHVPQDWPEIASPHLEFKLFWGGPQTPATAYLRHAAALWLAHCVNPSYQIPRSVPAR